MAKGNNQKFKLIYLIRILEKLTDEDHSLTMSQIIDKLENEQKTAISNIVSAVVAHKQKGFISYDEEAMANVTGGKYKFIKYRN